MRSRPHSILHALAALSLIVPASLTACGDGGGGGGADTLADARPDSATDLPLADGDSGFQDTPPLDGAPDQQGDTPGPDAPDGTVDQHPAVGAVVFTELMIDSKQVADDDGEWMELQNVGSAAVDLSGCALVSGQSERFTLTASLPMAAGARVLVARRADPGVNGGLTPDLVQTTVKLSNASDDVALECGGVTIDRVAWDSTWPVVEGAALSLDPGSTGADLNDEADSWCAASQVYGDGDRGTPGDANLACSAVSPCTPNPCQTPPASSCSGDVLTVYSAPGVCTADGGVASCDYQPSTADCQALFGSSCEAGACTGAPLAPAAAGDVLITELMVDPSAVADTDGEWIEVTNTTSDPLLLGGCSLSSDSDSPHTIDAALVIAPGAYLVLGRESDEGLNGGVTLDYAYGGSLNLTNTADSVSLTCGGVVIDAVAYDEGAGWPDLPGHSLSLDPGSATASANDDPASWCPGAATFGAGDFGSPGAANAACPDPCDGVVCDAPPAADCQGNAVRTYAATGTCQDGGCAYAASGTTDCGSDTCQGGVCIDPGEVAAAPTAGQVVISEIMQNPAKVSDSQGEWFELTNGTGSPVELAGCVLSSGTSKHTLATGGSLVLGANGVMVLGVNGTTETNGGVAVDYVYSGITLGNGADDLALTCADVLIDAVAYDGGDTFPDPEGRSLYLDGTQLSASANDLGASWCAGFEPYGAGDMGSPGTLNGPCPGPCDGVQCSEPPAPTCSGDLVQSYAAEGTCAEGTCTYAALAPVDCAASSQVCIAGACQAPGPPQPGAGEVVITEYMADPSAVDDSAGEWIELLSLASDTRSLAGCVLGDGASNSVTIATAVTLGAGARVVLGRNADTTKNGGVTLDYAYGGSFALNNSTPDAIILDCGGVVVDAVSYGTGWPQKSGSAVQLDPDKTDPTQNDQPASWCLATTALNATDFGTPGAANTPCVADPCQGITCKAPPAASCVGDVVHTPNPTGVCQAGSCTYAETTVDCALTGKVCKAAACVAPGTNLPGPGELVITEIMKNATGDDTGKEWFELYNPTGETFDLQGCVVGDAATDQHTISTDAPLLIGPGAFLVLAQLMDPLANGGLTPDYAYGNGVVFGNGSDGVRLECGGELVDRVDYTDAEFPDTDGKALSLDPGSATASANDSGGAWCDATDTYGQGDFGSPGAANPVCPADPCAGVVCDTPPAPDCLDNSVRFYADTGTCGAGGACTYATASTVDCMDATCQGGSCVGGGAPKPGAGEVIFTEIMYDYDAVGVSDDTGREWLEVLNVSPGTVDLGGCILGDGENTATLAASPSLVMGPGERRVLAQSIETATNGGLAADAAYGTALTLGNSGDQIALTCAGVVVDAVDFALAGFLDPSGSSLSLDPGVVTAEDNDSPTAWCTATTTYGDGNKGTPGDPNPACPVTGCDDPPAPTCASGEVITWQPTGNVVGGRCTYAAATTTPCTGGDICEAGACVDPATSDVFSAFLFGETGDLVINEIMVNPAVVADSDAEWFEVLNFSVDDLDFAGCVISSGAETHTIAPQGSLVIPAFGFAVFAVNRDIYSNGGLAVDYEYDTIGLSNADGGDDLTITCDTVVLDSVVFDNGPAFPDPGTAGRSMRLDQLALDTAVTKEDPTVDNDDGANWCPADSASVYGDGSNAGTPGSDNGFCP